MVLTTKIYVKLLNEGTDVWRPIEAQEIGSGIFLILNDFNYDPEDEELEFGPGTMVYCDLQLKSSGKVLVAQKRV